MPKTEVATEFGDFQTPERLAAEACLKVAERIAPASVLEPTCGKGHFLLAAMETFPTVVRALGADINKQYVKECEARLRKRGLDDRAEALTQDFFRADWSDLLSTLPDPILVIGNPPWVTNSALSSLGSNNLPEKSNFQKHVGFAAKTGKANFDISEWMLINLLDRLRGRRGVLAMLCKTAVARKALLHCWKNDIPLGSSDLYRVDAAKHFGAAVDACFLVCDLSPEAHAAECRVFDSLQAGEPRSVFGYRDGQVVANTPTYDRLRHLRGECDFTWRSGVKHDCSRVMELLRVDEGLYRNGLGEEVRLEDRYLYPMLKSSGVAKEKSKRPDRWMLVTQKSVGEDTAAIRDAAPRTWEYLNRHADALGRRASSIYKNRPPFSVFGVGSYTFAPWKVGISGFYKSLRFTMVGPLEGRPVVLDDTSYFLSCETEEDAEALASLLNSHVATKFFSSLVFWDAKRPITIGLLSQLDIPGLADEMGLGRGHVLPYREERAPRKRRQSRLKL